MARPPAEHPTDLELQILRILWLQSPLPVREVRQRLAESGRAIAHTSTITTLNTMVRKGYLNRRLAANALLFSPCVEEADVTRRMLDDLVHRAFSGSVSSAALALFDSRSIDAEELRELRKLINQKIKDQSES